MKVLFVAFLALAVGASALPHEYELENRQQERIIAGQIREAVEGISQLIRDSGWDPLWINRFSIENSPQPEVNIKLLIEKLDLVGLSHIEVDRVDWSTLASRLRLTLVLPGIRFSLGNGALEVDFVGTKYNGELSGTFQLSRLVMTFDIRVNIGIISGISIRSADCTLRIGNLQSNFAVVINEEDYSEQMNNLINIRIPRWMQSNQSQIDRTFSDVVKEIGNRVLGGRNM